MNIRVLTFFALMLSMSGISNAAKTSAPLKLLPKPVVFVDLRKVEADWLVGCNRAWATYKEKGTEICKAANSIANQLGACAVCEKSGTVLGLDVNIPNELTDPAYDITQKVIDVLNKDYLATIAKAKESKKKLVPQARLHYAILNNSPEEIKESVKTGANVNNPINGKAPIFWAIVLKKTNAVECLLSLGAKVNEMLISFALKVSDVKSAFLIAKRCGADINTEYLGWCNQQETLLQAAVSNAFSNSLEEKTKLILELVRNGADISKLNSKKWFQEAVVNFLWGVQDNKTIINSILELIQEIINRTGCNVNDFWFTVDGSNPSHIYGCKEALELLINNGANPNHVIHDLSNDYGISRTPLMEALRSYNPAAVKFLLDSGANVNQKAKPLWNQELMTPLKFVLEDANVSRNTQMIELLLEHGASL